ncbi:MAG: cell division FtsA domain-containing protein [bacterium]
MSIFSRSKEKKELILVFSIGTSSVAGAFFQPQSSGIPKLVFSIEEPIRIETSINIERLLFLTTKSLEVVVKKAFSCGLGAPNKIFCVLSSPWNISQSRIVNYRKNTPFIFTEKLADSLVQKEIALLEEEYLAKNKGVGNLIRRIELKNIKTMLNGYEISKPLNQKAKELEMTIFISMSGELVLKEIEKTIELHFNQIEINFSSFSMAFFTVVRDAYARQENFLLVDIGGEVTDISMIKKNSLRESTTFPLGCNFLSRGISTELGCTLNEASSLVSLFKDGHAKESANKKLLATMDKLKISWLKKFQDSLANLSNDISIPSTIYIVVDKNLSSFFCETIKAEQFNQYTLTESKFKIILLGVESLHGIVSFEESVAREPLIIVCSSYINRFLI